MNQRHHVRHAVTAMRASASANKHQPELAGRHEHQQCHHGEISEVTDRDDHRIRICVNE
jgi:hypothetical protein